MGIQAGARFARNSVWTFHPGDLPKTAYCVKNVLPGPTVRLGGRPQPAGRSLRRGTAARSSDWLTAAPGRQGLTLVHFTAQRKRFLCDMGCI